MKQPIHKVTTILIFIFMLILIFDARLCLQGAQEGINLCLTTVVPALLPFIFLSGLLTERLYGRTIPLISKISQLCGIPQGAESILLLGFIGGYPIGATTISNAYKQGKLSKSTAERMLGFCNNAGPAFIFGMVGSLFENWHSVWLIWLIHIISALIVGIILPGKSADYCKLQTKTPDSITLVLERSVSIMLNICGWVILFHILLAFLEKWVLWLMPSEIGCGLCGLLELTNGVLCLNILNNSNLRFILCSAMLSIGGLCVFMQTLSVSKGLNMRNYFLGKIMQCAFSVLLSLLVLYVQTPTYSQIALRSVCFISIFLVLTAFTFLLWKKVVAKLKQM